MQADEDGNAYGDSDWDAHTYVDAHKHPHVHINAKADADSYINGSPFHLDANGNLVAGTAPAYAGNQG